MKLYELPSKSYFYIKSDPAKTPFFLNNLDGMYSNCSTESNDVVHIAVFTEVEPLEFNYYHD